MASHIIGRENRLVPLSPTSNTTLQTEARLRLAPPAGTSATTHAATGVPAPASREGFVLRFGFGHRSTYLHQYRDSSGTWETSQLGLAKIFRNHETAVRTASLLRARVVRVLTDHDGSNPRLALFHNRFSPRTSSQSVMLREEKARANEKDERETDNHASPEAKQQSERRIAVTAPAWVAEGGVFCRKHPVSNDAKTLLLQFISNYLGVRVFGVQAGFKSPDFYLFEGPFGTTMAVPTTVMLVNRAAALSLIQEKLSQKKRAFEKDPNFHRRPHDYELQPNF